MKRYTIFKWFLLNKKTLNQNERGIVLITSLMFMAILSVLGATAYFITYGEILISRNHQSAVVAFYAAEAGIAEAKSRISNIREDEPSAGWRGFIGVPDLAKNHFGFNSENPDHHLFAGLQNDMEYTVMIRHKKDDATDEPVLWGDPNNDYLNEENTSIGSPVEIIVGCGLSGNAAKTISVEVKKEPLFFNPPTALFVNGNLKKTGATGSAVGAYGTCDPVSDIITTVNSDDGYEASNWPAGTSDPPRLVDDEGKLYPVESVLEQLAQNADEIIPSGTYINNEFETEDSTPGVFFCEGNLELLNIEGFGILAVKGRLTISGNIFWKGIIISGEELKIETGTIQEIKGSIIADDDVEIEGNPDIIYDCSVIQSLERELGTYRVYSWKDF